MKVIFLSILLSIVFPTTLIVPSDQYPTIQSGIDAATVGDTVLVSDGMYDENLILDNSMLEDPILENPIPDNPILENPILANPIQESND